MFVYIPSSLLLWKRSIKLIDTFLSLDIHSKPCEADLLEWVGDYIDSKWQNFGIELGIRKNVCEGIKQQKLCIPKECFILLCSKWLSSGAGTGDKPRTWRTVLQAVRECGFPEVADQVERSFSKNPGV